MILAMGILKVRRLSDDEAADPAIAARLTKRVEHRRLRDVGFRRTQEEGMRLPHVAPINALVDQLHAETGNWLPYVAPDSGGIDASILLIARDPGPMTNPAGRGSGFLCRENDDATAERLAWLLDESGIPANCMMYWNAYPWYINMKPTSAQLGAGVIALRRLIELLPHLRVVILSGVDARLCWKRFTTSHPIVAARYTALPTYHTGNQAFVGSADVRAQRMGDLRAVFDRAAVEIGNSTTPELNERQATPAQPAPSYIAASNEASSPLAADGHVLLVGCLQEVETQRVLGEFSKNGVAASPWSFSLTPEQQSALRACPHLYVYRPAASWLQPKKAIVECLRVDDWRSSAAGIACPWPQLSGPYGQRTTLLDGKPIRAWFRVVGRSVLTVPITAHYALRVSDGNPVNPKAPGLLSSFNLWRLKSGVQVGLPCLTTTC